ncbi:hypothetical protein OEW28_01330 [Defluviimonas sp. WL0002]|uniref:Uncharacterized protein n=1 Tax=Albidovulum marisflavi TaxID=2984159 RepID=A0ABT2Z811_9RHOB|nr:hypothetical protein [Defluviimonas sp. WL0002]MCV2867267.1 hypothetical protein [Defluviimonas sp. WL0002]
MPTINLYLEPEDALPAQDVKKIADKVKGKTKTFSLPDKYLNATKIKSNFDVRKELLLWAGKEFGLSGAGAKTLVGKAGLQGRLTEIGSYDLVFTVSADVAGEVKTFRIKGELEILAKDPIAAPEPCKVTYANGKVRSACEGDRNLKTKIESIALAGPTETGHGRVPYLGGALHAHATNTESVAWFWKGETMHVVATGKKNNQNKTQQRGGKGAALKTMQYDWDEG